MPNIKSAKKRVLVSKMQNEKNRAVKTGLKTHFKKFDAALAAGVGAEDAMKAAVSSVDRAVAKGVIHKNTAARRKSRLAKQLNAAQAAK